MIYYNFDQNLGGGFYNQITESQKQRAREIFELYGNYLGIDFIEDTALTGGRGLIVGTGDLQALSPLIPSGPGGVAGLAGGGVAVMDMAESWNNEYNGKWFNVAMHEIGHLLGLGHTYDLPGYTIMGSSNSEYYVASAEAMYPGISGHHPWSVPTPSRQHRCRRLQFHSSTPMAPLAPKSSPNDLTTQACSTA